MKIKDCFNILCISRDASLKEAKQSYKRLVKRWHPDQYGKDPEMQRVAHEKLKEINVAYRELVSLLKRTPGPSDSLPKKRAAGYRRSPTDSKDVKKNKFFERMASLFKTNQEESVQRQGPGGERDSDHFQSVRKSPGNNNDMGNVTPDFSKTLKHALHRHPRGASARRKNAVRTSGNNRKRVHRPMGNKPFSRPYTTPRRTHGDEVEKITPVRRVGKIGE